MSARLPILVVDDEALRRIRRRTPALPVVLKHLQAAVSRLRPGRA